MASTKGKKALPYNIGESLVYCQGKIVTGPDRIYFYLAFGMTFLPSVVFMAAVYVLGCDPGAVFTSFLRLPLGNSRLFLSFFDNGPFCDVFMSCASWVTMRFGGCHSNARPGLFCCKTRKVYDATTSARMTIFLFCFASRLNLN